VEDDSNVVSVLDLTVLLRLLAKQKTKCTVHYHFRKFSYRISGDCNEFIYRRGETFY